MNDKLSTLIIALLGGAVGVLGVGALTDAHADPVASSQQPLVIRIESPAATAGGDVTENVVKLSDVEGLCALGKPAPSKGGSGRASSGSSVNSSGNSANTNTNVLALSNQIGLEQQTIVVQQSDNAAAAVAAQEQGQEQGQEQQQEQAVTTTTTTLPPNGPVEIVEEPTTTTTTEPPPAG